MISVRIDRAYAGVAQDMNWSYRNAGVSPGDPQPPAAFVISKCGCHRSPARGMVIVPRDDHAYDEYDENTIYIAWAPFTDTDIVQVLTHETLHIVLCRLREHVASHALNQIDANDRVSAYGRPLPTSSSTSSSSTASSRARTRLSTRPSTPRG